VNHSESQLRTNPRIVPPDLLLKFGYSPNGGIKFDSAAQSLSFYQDGTKRVDIRSFGLAVRDGEGLVVGHTSQIAAGGVTSEFQMLGTGSADSRAIIGRWGNDNGHAGLIGTKSRNPAIGSNTVVQNGDGVFFILATADDGTDYASQVGRIAFEVDGTPGVNDMPGRIVFSTTPDGSASVLEALRIDSSQNVQMRNESYLWIGPDSVATGYGDANLAVGLVINQEANDNGVIVLKSSDVGHAMTGLGEADTFAAFSKSAALSGGLRIRAFKDADEGGNGALRLEGVLGEAAEIDDTSASQALVVIDASVTDGGTGRQAVAATGNAIALATNDTMLFIVKGDGTLHATNVTAGGGDLDGVALDDYDDIGLIRAHQAVRSDGLGMAMTKWDEALTANKDDLIRLGVYGSDGSMYNMQRMNDLLGGAIWQQHTTHMSLVERVDELTSQLAIASKQLAALTA